MRPTDTPHCRTHRAEGPLRADPLGCSRRAWIAGGLGAAAVAATGRIAGAADDAAGSDAAGRDATASGEGASGDGARLVYDAPETQRWRIGLVLRTPVTCTGVLATFPVPMNWPEQSVRVVDQQIDPRVGGWKPRDLAGGARQVVVQIPRITAGSTAEVSFEFEIERSRILPPETTGDLVIPSRPDRELRHFLGNSPYIDASDRGIREASREIEAMPAETDWERVELIYDYVRDKVQYIEGPLRDASEALRRGEGDCEEMTSLFVALCRNAGVPARMVWIPDHCYPEFYLETPHGDGHWFPCQAAGTRQFGRMDEYRPVLQKGDRFKVPERRTPVRYISEFFRCNRRGRGEPDPKFIRERIDV